MHHAQASAAPSRANGAGGPCIDGDTPDSASPFLHEKTRENGEFEYCLPLLIAI